MNTQTLDLIEKIEAARSRRSALIEQYGKVDKISSELSERVINLNMLIGAQFGYEINLNRYQQGRLPNYSYLYLFQNFFSSSD